MPTYEYLCPQCGQVTEEYRSMARRREDGECAHCHGVSRFAIITAPHTQSSYLDNHLYGNGTDVFDMGLGATYGSRRQREQIMETKGLVPMEAKTADEALSGPTIKQQIAANSANRKAKLVEMLKESRAEINAGKKPKKPAPSVFETVEKTQGREQASSMEKLYE